MAQAKDAAGHDPSPFETLAGDQLADLLGPEQQRETERDSRDRGRVDAIRSSDRFWIPTSTPAPSGKVSHLTPDARAGSGSATTRAVNQRPTIGDYGLISDCRSAALVSSHGSIDWCCMPRLDHGSSCARLLDERAGHFSLRPAAELSEPPRHEYVPGTMLLVTTFTTAAGELRLTDCFILPGPDEPAGGSRIVRIAEVVRGEIELEIELAPRFDYGEVDPWIRRHGPGLHSAIGGDDGLVIWSSHELDIDDRHTLAAAVTLAEGDSLRLAIASCDPVEIDRSPVAAFEADQVDRSVELTEERWRGWSDELRFDGDGVEQVRRSALTLKALSQSHSGAVAAAATTSLPEGLGAMGERNWDYRYSWVRDSTLAVRSLARLGFESAAEDFRSFIERSAAGNADDLQVLFGLGGERRLQEIELSALAGYRGAQPVRIGNGAADQLQLDAYGMILEQSWRWRERGHEIEDEVWVFLADLVETAAERWTEPDAGFWEARASLHFTHSKVLCWTAIDRGIRLAEQDGRDAPLERWRHARSAIAETIDSRGVDPDRGVFVRDFESNDLDASSLRFPIVDYCEWTDERMIRTADAIDEGLDLGGLLRRYEVDDGFNVAEGAFLSCSFWLAECFARQGRTGRAKAAFERTMATANELGLFSEEYDPDAGEMLGNFPQALTHLSHLEAALAIAEAEG
jgi:GH15 family glucan-1,4-alpha-glucosidase